MNSAASRVAFAVLSLLVSPVVADAALDKPTMDAFGGTYLADCAAPAGPRVVVAAEEFVVIDGARKFTAKNLETAASWYGQEMPPEYRVVILSRVNDDPALLFALYEDANGYYGKLDGDPSSAKGMRPELMGMTFRLCKAAPAEESTRKAEAPAARKPEAPAAKTPEAKPSTPENVPEAKPAAPASAFVEPDSSGGAALMMKDKSFRTAYVKAMGPRMRERWIAVLDGPAPPNRNVSVGGQEYVLVAACKAHDCVENNLVVLWAAGKKPLMYGLVRQVGVNALLGAPTPELTTEITRLWQETWRTAEKPAP